jgi:hypothetical protein
MKLWSLVQGSMFKASELIQSGSEVFLTLNLEHCALNRQLKLAEQLERFSSLNYSRAGLRRILYRRFNHAQSQGNR